MKIQSFAFNQFQENTYILYDDSKSCVIIDAGCYEKSEQQELVNFIETNGLSVDKILSTHGHIDHVLGNNFVTSYFKAKLYVYELDVETHLGVKAYASMYGFPNYLEKEPDEILKDGTSSIQFGNTTLQILFAPGHAPGHIVFFHRESNNLIGGDVLFNRSIGRTDLPGGDHDTLINSIHNVVFPLGDEVIVHCGHGPTTTIGEEKVHNPFCAIAK